MAKSARRGSCDDPVIARAQPEAIQCVAWTAVPVRASMTAPVPFEARDRHGGQLCPLGRTARISPDPPSLRQLYPNGNGSAGSAPAFVYASSRSGWL